MQLDSFIVKIITVINQTLSDYIRKKHEKLLQVIKKGIASQRKHDYKLALSKERTISQPVV